MEYILELQQVCKTFPKTNFALDQVSFSIPYGSIMGFVGENGAGKTTSIVCPIYGHEMPGMVKEFIRCAFFDIGFATFGRPVLGWS